MIINEKRALAYVVTIDEIKPIEGYDRVEYARTNGWWVIINKGDNLKVGDKCVYFEVDSKCPDTDERFAFLAKRHYKIKTIKMCKVFSQGLLMPISIFPEIGEDPEVNTDVTDILKVKYSVEEDNKRKSNGNPNAKYSSMAARHKNLFKRPMFRWLMRRDWGKKLLFVFFGRKKDNPLSFPKGFEYVHKTDEERVENMPWVLGYDKPLIVTEKLDGTSCTYILERKPFNKYEFYVSSRNVRQLKPEQSNYHTDTGATDTNIYWELAFKYNIEKYMREYLEANPSLKYVCIQGEGVGAVQGNPLKLNQNALFVFNFIRSDVGRISSVDGQKIVSRWGLYWVPILDTEYMMPSDMEEFKEFATAASVVNDSVMREGIVLRDPTTGLSFKNVSREYLMKHNG